MTLFPYLIGSTVIVFLVRLLLLQRKPQASEPVMPMNEKQLNTESNCTGDIPPRRFRLEYASGPGGLVFGWPSKGGIYTLDRCFGVELDFLELDRFHNIPRPSPSDPDAAADEEAHCDRSKESFISFEGC